MNYFFWFVDEMSIFVRFYPVKYVMNFDLVNLFRIMSSINAGDSSFPYANRHVNIAIPNYQVYKLSSIFIIS